MQENNISVDWMILADAAQIADGKAYILGGGWSVMRVPAFPAQVQAALAISFVVPWTLTNRPNDFELAIVDEDGQKLSSATAGIEAGRPLGLSAGESQHFPVVLNFGLIVPKSGTYVVTLMSGELEYARTAFKVVQAANVPPMLAKP